jgi:catechol 2,3-dioxygenase-like lactoylglutathione lyase family enzyme
MDKPRIGPISPFFIVRNVGRTVDFYRDRLGFQTRYQEPDGDPFFAIVGRDGGQILLKHIGEETPPLPNPQRHPGARWDAFVHAPDPDALAEEFSRRGAAFKEPLKDTHDGLRGFEIRDLDGHVLFFGRPK